jgi:adenosine deaminase
VNEFPALARKKVSELLPDGVVQTELHRHLDVSIRASTLLEILKREGREPEKTQSEEFKRRLVLLEPMSDLPTVLNLFQTFQKAFVGAGDCARIAFEVAEDCYHEGTRRVELRWSPNFISEITGIPWEEALEGFMDGLARAKSQYPDLEAGFIGIVSRDYGVEAAKKTIRFVLDHSRSFIGLDLAGNELQWPNHQFTEVFAPARRSGIPITIHAGEASGPSEMWDAIDRLGARRIGHGVACIQDPLLMRELVRRNITLEICPTSNWLTQCAPTIEQHPVVRILREGVPVSINTDDPGVFAVTLQSEINLCRDHMGMTDDETRRILKTAHQASFLNRF